MSEVPPPPPESTPPDVPPTPPSAAPLEYSSGGYPGPYTGPEPDKDAKLWGMLAHLSAFIGVTAVVPSVVGPLVVWLIKKDEMPFVNDQGKEALNFHISLLIVLLALSPTLCIGIGIFLLPAVGVVALVLTIIAAVAANKGEAYRYPFTLRLIK